VLKLRALAVIDIAPLKLNWFRVLGEPKRLWDEIGYRRNFKRVCQPVELVEKHFLPTSLNIRPTMLASDRSAQPRRLG